MDTTFRSSKRSCSAAGVAPATPTTRTRTPTPRKSSSPVRQVPIGTSCRQKSRSHLVLFEEVSPHPARDRISRQTEHHNAIGYLVKPQFTDQQQQHCSQSPATSKQQQSEPASPFGDKLLAQNYTNLLSYGSTLNDEIKGASKSQLDIYERYHSYQRAMSPDKPMLTLADRNQSSAVAQAIGGFGYDTFASSTNAPSHQQHHLGRRPQSSLGVSGISAPLSSLASSNTTNLSPSSTLVQSPHFRSQLALQRPTFEEGYFGDAGYQDGNQYRQQQSQSFYETTFNGRSTTPPPMICMPAVHSSQQHLNEHQHSSKLSSNKKQPEHRQLQQQQKQHHRQHQQQIQLQQEQQYHSDPRHHHHTHHPQHQRHSQQQQEAHQHHQRHPATQSIETVSPKSDSEESFFSLVEQPEQNQTRSHSTPYTHSYIQTNLYSTNRMEAQNSSQNRLLIKNCRCVNDDSIFDADIYVEEGIIKEIGQHLIVPGGVKTIDAEGHYVLPGGIDTHTHMNMPFMGAQTVDDFFSGTRAAVAGGTTTIMDFVIPEKNASLMDAYQKWRSWADDQACCDYVLRVAIPSFKPGKTDAEMEQLVRECGVNSFKCFMAYKDMFMLRDDELLSVFKKCAQLGALAMVHAENGDIIDYNISKLKSLGITGPEGHIQSRPEEVEAEATNRALTIANQVNCPIYVVHVMSKSAADVIVAARNRGVIGFGEAITAGFGSDGTHYFNRCWRHAAAHILSPPLRPDTSTADHLITLMASGQIQTTGSDHCTFDSKQKALGNNDFSKIPNGVNGVEERMIILWERGVRNGKMDPRQFVSVTSANAAKMFNIYPRKGRLAKGSDADIVIWGPKHHVIRAENHHSKVDFNIFEGTEVANGPLVVISNGKVVLDEDGLHVAHGSGRFIPCPPNADYVYGSIRNREKILPIKVDRSEKPDDEKTPVAKSFGVSRAIPAPVILDSPRPSSGNVLSTNGFHRGMTRSGVRNQQDSSFNLAGQQIDDDRQSKTSTRVHNPPGGRSSGIF